MLEFNANKLSEHVTQIIDPTEVSSFLITGEKEALLVDTGVGIKGLKEKVEELTDKPVTVVLTHGHGDHAGGAADFDKVYMTFVDRELLKTHDINMRMGYAGAMMGPDAGLVEADFVADMDVDKLLELKAGQVFDLGGIHVEMVAVPGHTKGSCTALVKEERSMIYGDACNCNTLVMDESSACISEYLESLKALQKRESEFDTVYYSHGPATGPKSCLEDNMELCERILAGTDDAVECDFMGRKAIRAAALGNGYERADGKYGNIVYSEQTKK